MPGANGCGIRVERRGQVDSLRGNQKPRAKLPRCRATFLPSRRRLIPPLRTSRIMKTKKSSSALNAQAVNREVQIIQPRLHLGLTQEVQRCAAISRCSKRRHPLEAPASRSSRRKAQELGLVPVLSHDSPGLHPGQTLRAANRVVLSPPSLSWKQRKQRPILQGVEGVYQGLSPIWLRIIHAAQSEDRRLCQELRVYSPTGAVSFSSEGAEF